MMRRILKMSLVGLVLFAFNSVNAQHSVQDIVKVYQAGISNLTASQSSQLEQMVKDYTLQSAAINEEAQNDKQKISMLQGLNNQMEKKLATFLSADQLVQLKEVFDRNFNQIKMIGYENEAIASLTTIDQVVRLTDDQREEIRQLLIKMSREKQFVYDDVSKGRLTENQAIQKLKDLELNYRDKFASLLTKEQQDRWLTYEARVQKK